MFTIYGRIVSNLPTICDQSFLPMQREKKDNTGSWLHSQVPIFLFSLNQFSKEGLKINHTLEKPILISYHWIKRMTSPHPQRKNNHWIWTQETLHTNWQLRHTAPPKTGTSIPTSVSILTSYITSTSTYQKPPTARSLLAACSKASKFR